MVIVQMMKSDSTTDVAEQNAATAERAIIISKRLSIRAPILLATFIRSNLANI